MLGPRSRWFARPHRRLRFATQYHGHAPAFHPCLVMNQGDALTRCLRLAALMPFCFGCFVGSAQQDTDFGASVLVPELPVVAGSSTIPVQVVLRRADGTPVPNLVVQLEAAGCDIAQATAPTDARGTATATLLA